jgi:hypothetical protein
VAPLGSQAGNGLAHFTVADKENLHEKKLGPAAEATASR